MSTPSWDQLLERAIMAILAERLRAMPARVLSYDSATQEAQVQPAIRIATGDIDGDGIIDYDTLPVLTVPVAPLRGGGYAIHVPLQAGDWVMIMPASRSLDEWLTDGGVDVEPADLRMSDLQDSVAYPIPYPRSDALGADVAREGELVLSSEAGDVQVRLRAGEVIVTAPTVRLGGPGASAPVALAPLVAGELAKIQAAITLLSGQLMTLGQLGGVYVPSGVAASKARAE